MSQNNTPNPPLTPNPFSSEASPSAGPRETGQYDPDLAPGAPAPAPQDSSLKSQASLHDAYLSARTRAETAICEAAVKRIENLYTTDAAAPALATY